MGWWNQNAKGESFAEDPMYDMVWGDSVADVMADALDEIRKEFREVWGREPSVLELEAGLNFSLPSEQPPFPPRRGGEAYLGGLENRVPAETEGAVTRDAE
jgi:hypothetical protein